MRAYALSTAHRAAPGRATRLLVAIGLAVGLLAPTAACSHAAKQVDPGVGAIAQPGPTGAGKPHAPQRTPDKVMVGAYLDLAGKKAPESLALRRQQLGRDPRIIHYYYDWQDPLPDHFSGVSADTIVMLSWGATYYDPIIKGTEDTMIARSADAIARYNKPIFLRWAWEMNGNWFDWGGPKNRNNPAGFVAAWKHVHDIFVAHGASNVAWVWSPNANSVPDEPRNDLTRYYPGDEYVDWIGISGYLGGAEDPDSLFGFIDKTYGPRKPIMIAETGALERGGSVKADWINELAAWIKAHVAIAALVWFDTDNDRDDGKNWRIDSSAGSLAAYQKMTNDPYFNG